MITATSNITVELVHHYGSDRRMAEKAWVSTAKGAGRTDEDVARIVRFLYTHGHCQCLMCSGVAFRIYAPYRSLVQVIRHLHSNPFMPQEQVDTDTHSCQSSARYGAVPTELYVSNVLNNIEDEELKGKVDEMIEHSMRSMELWHEVNNTLKGKQSAVRDEINNMLPQGAFGYLDFDLNAWSLRNFLIRRLDKHAQASLREIATKMFHLVMGLEEFKTFNQALGNELRSLGLVEDCMEANT